MICTCREDLKWDNEAEKLINWDSATPCGQEATHAYIGGVKVDLCARHAARWSLIINNFIGKIVQNV